MEKEWLKYYKKTGKELIVSITSFKRSSNSIYVTFLRAGGWIRIVMCTNGRWWPCQQASGHCRQGVRNRRDFPALLSGQTTSKTLHNWFTGPAQLSSFHRQKTRQLIAHSAALKRLAESANGRRLEMVIYAADRRYKEQLVRVEETGGSRAIVHISGSRCMEDFEWKYSFKHV